MSRRAAVLLAAALIGAGASAASAQSPASGVPDPTDCHAMNKLLHLDNVRSCDGPLGTQAKAAPPPPPVSVQHRPDGSICVTVSLQVPHCVGPIA